MRESNLEKLSVQFLAPHPWQWVILLIPALALAFLAYYKIAAPLTRPARSALWVLRGTAFLLVLLACAQPVLTAVLQDSRHPALAVLLDRSASMALSAGNEAPGKSRAAEAADIARRLSQELEGRYRLHWYAFSDAVRPTEPDSALAPGGTTALGQAIEEVLTAHESRPLSGVVVVSDGVSTMGRDPVRIAAASPVPIFTVPVGPGEPPTDLEIRRVRTNPSAFVGEPTPIQTVLSSWGLAGQTIRLEVKDQGVVVAAKEVRILGDRGLEQEVPLEVRPSRPGLTLFEVSAVGTQDSIPQDDRRLVALDVLERKTRVLVLSSRLDWDFAFLRRTLSADTTLGYTFLAQVRPGQYDSYGEKRLIRLPASAADLRDFAAVLVSGVGDAGLPGPVLDLLARYVRDGGGLFLVGGPSHPVGWVQNGSFAAILPGSIGPDPMPANRTLPVTVTQDGQRHPATAIRENPAETAQLWAALPPLWRPGGSLTVNPEARRLLDYRSGQGRAGSAALAVSFQDRGKVAWLYGAGIWRWGFQPAGGSVADDFYPQFLFGLVRWLAEPTVRERFQVNPSKRVYQNGERIEFTGSLWDAAYAPVGGAQIVVAVRPERGAPGDSDAVGSTRIDLQAGSDLGSYDGQGAVLPPGAYRFSAVARGGTGDHEIGRSEGRFWVETMGPEFARTWTDREQMRLMAEQSHGRTANAADLSSLVEQIPRAMRRMGRIREIEVWNHWLLFASFVTVLSVEWFLRRRRGLA
jgi:hypothetical protein